MLTITFTTQNDPNRLWRATLGAGFCGALTTFSALQIETINLARAGSPVLAVAYALASLVAGFGLAVGIAALHRARAA
jgi:CrcB protein